MPQREKATSQDCILVMNARITTNTDTEGSIIDMADYDGGVYFAAMCQSFDNTAADLTLTIYGGNESDLSDSTSALVSVNLVYGTNVVLDDALAAGSKLSKEGVLGNFRYARPVITSTGIDGYAVVMVIAICNAEVLPTKQS
jgi:hypothetical protein